LSIDPKPTNQRRAIRNLRVAFRVKGNSTNLKTMNYRIALVAGLWAAVQGASAQQAPPTAVLPYNPDSDGTGTIEVADILSVLPFFGQPFVAEGVVGVEFGGTGSTTPEDARVALGLALFKDSLAPGQTSPWGWVDGTLRVTGNFAHGGSVVSTGEFAHASGSQTQATGPYSRATNRLTTASAICSSAEGEGTTSSGTASHAEGMLTLAAGTASHAEGYNTDALSNYAHAEGFNTTASSNSSHAEGYQTTASGLYSHSENRQTTASGASSHAQGQNSSATGDVSHAEGFGCIAGGYAAHAQGYQTSASGLYSHAAGRTTTAMGTSSAAFGLGTVADQAQMLVTGTYNLEGQTGTVFAVGTGTAANARATAFDVNANGSARFTGPVTCTNSLTVGSTNVGTTLASLTSLVATLQAQVAVLQAQVAALQSGQ
jgi:hypothetical protein